MLPYSTREHIKKLSGHQKQVLRYMCSGKILAYNEGHRIAPVLLNTDESVFKKLRADTVCLIFNEYGLCLVADYTLQNRVRQIAMQVKDDCISDILKLI